jgi:hypothetical protein
MELRTFCCDSASRTRAVKWGSALRSASALFDLLSERPVLLRYRFFFGRRVFVGRLLAFAAANDLVCSACVRPHTAGKRSVAALDLKDLGGELMTTRVICRSR